MQEISTFKQLVTWNVKQQLYENSALVVGMKKAKGVHRISTMKMYI
jgi:hypothetical protein